MLTHDVEVLVVGLGPVGAVAALQLARHGITVAAVDASSEQMTDLRASTFHAPTIEMLDELGATNTLFQQGLRAPIYQFRDRQSSEVFEFDLTELSDHTRYPYRIQCEQHRVTAEVVDQLRMQPHAQVAHQTRLLYLEQDERGVTAWVETPVSVERYRAKYLVAADGSSSVVRKLLELDFPGFTYDEKFLCLSTEYPVEEAFPGLSHVNYISDPEEWLVLLRVPGLWRILVPASAQLSDAELLSDENKDDIFRRMLQKSVDITTRHRTIYRVHQRVCRNFVVGRIGLVGDAVHLNSPMGGFGMNSGIHDAINLCDKLVKLLRHNGDPALLALYERQRRTVTEDFVQTQTIENTRMMNSGWTEERTLRRDRMRKMQNDRDARREYLLRQSMFRSLEQAAAIT